MEQVFQYISKNYVTVDKGRIRSANPIVKSVVMKITDEMQNVSPLFKTMFETHLFAGSSYDGLKVGRPDEYDIDIKLFVPKKLDLQVIPSDKPGFVYLQLKGWKKLKKDNSLSRYGELADFLTDDNYLSQDEIKNWMESIVSRAINRIEERGEFRRDIGSVTYRRSGPAVTLDVQLNNNTHISIDLVAVIRIPGEKWLPPPVRQNFSRKKKSFLVVAKPPSVVNIDELAEDIEKYFRLSFPEQEMEYMNNYYTLKPVLRFIKKVRDTHHHNIPSYFIKTIFLWAIRRQNRERSYWQDSFMNVFIEMLGVYRDYLDNHNIPYFWNSSHNLIEPHNYANIENIRDFLDGMITNIESARNTDPLVLAEYILPRDEYERVRQYFDGIL